jgi:predicted dehydrogenase
MLGVAVIGYGWWGRHVTARLRGHDRLRVLCVAETDAGLHPDIAAEGLTALPDLDAALAHPGVDAVILTTPHMQHEGQVVAAAAAGRHVFCEKPLGLTAASAARSVAACRAAGVVLGIGHERRFEPAMQRLAAMVRAGDLGTILHAEATFSHDKLAGLPVGGWRTDAALSPGAGMTGMGIHLTDLMLWLFGPVATVQAQVRDRVLGWPTGDMVVAQLGFRAGMTAHFNALLATPFAMRFQVFGSRGWVEIRNATHPDTPGGVTDWLYSPRTGEVMHERLDWTDAVVTNLVAFADAVAGRASYPWTDTQLIHNIAVFEAIVRAARSGQTERPDDGDPQWP